MAINREGYASLIESVQEAVSAPSLSSSKGFAKASRGSRSTSTASNRPLQWGDRSIGGSLNARDLAYWLASQMGDGKPSPNTMTIGTEDGPVAGAFQRNASSVTSKSTGSSTASSKRPTALGLPTGSGLGKTTTGSSTTASTAGRVSGKSSKSNSRKSTSTTSGKTSGGSSSKPSAKRPTVSVADVQEALDILEELNESRWASGAALSYQLDRMQNAGPSVSDAPTKGGLRSRSRNPLARTSGTSSTGSRPTSKPAPKTPSVSVGIAEDWDILDEILAEGIELYGEDGLAEILADFADTGEISDELALLLSDESEALEQDFQLDEVSLKKKIGAYRERARREFESDGDDPTDFTKGGKSKADRTRENILKSHGPAAATHADRAAYAEIFGRKGPNMPPKSKRSRGA